MAGAISTINFAERMTHPVLTKSVRVKRFSQV
ncbi:uncharacterized protein G2W53_035177 [Senna tora]|uniref:Uncharacterized protein n=1 Tax=Senna tora TaxID=362788 RepID=A0A834SR06_9FABA|nr:uncharacterized protein G2W53_035177 [Senna tora]